MPIAAPVGKVFDEGGGGVLVDLGEATSEPVALVLGVVVPSNVTGDGRLGLEDDELDGEDDEPDVVNATESEESPSLLLLLLLLLVGEAVANHWTTSVSVLSHMARTPSAETTMLLVPGKVMVAVV